MKVYVLVLVVSLFGFTTCQETIDIAEDFNMVKKPYFRSCCPRRKMSLDLQNGEIDSLFTLPGAQNFKFTQSNLLSSTSNCSYMVDFKVTFDPLPKCIENWNPQCTDRPMCGQRLLRIDLEIDSDRGGYMFNVGDSATNNGYGGDANTQKNDAEIMGRGDDINTYYSDYCKDEKEELLNSLAGASYVTMWIGNEFTRIQTRDSTGTVLQDVRNCNKCLFALNMQDDLPVTNKNMDIYVALNKVIYIDEKERLGYGVCRAKLKWECCGDYFNYKK